MASHSCVSAPLARSTAILLVLSLVVPMLPSRTEAQPPSTHAARGYGARLTKDSLLYKLTFKTPQGDIVVSLPADSVAGEAVTATIHLKPRGGAAAAQVEIRRLLASYMLFIGMQSLPASESQIQSNLTADNRIAICLGTNEAPSPEHAQAAIALPLAAPTASSTLPPAKPSLPIRGRAGLSLALPRLADTDVSNVHVLIGGKESKLVASSPRLYVVETPPDVFGKTTLQVRKGDSVIAEGAFRSDRVNHSVNPWPYVLVTVAAVVIIVAVAVHNTLDNLNNGLQHLPPVNLQ